MNKNIEEVVDLLKNDERKNHVVLLSGNIYDTVVIGNHSFFDAADFILKITEIKFPNALRYDIFSGLSVVRGEEDEIAEKMGIGSGSQSQDPLVQALRQNGIARESKFPQSPTEVFLCLDRFFSSDEAKQAIVLVEYADTIMPGNQNAMQTNCQLSTALTKWARNSEIRKKGHLFFLLCRNPHGLDEEILQRVHEIAQIIFPKPSFEARKKFFLGNGVDAVNAHVLSSASSGLALKELNNLKTKSIEEVFGLKRKILSDEYGNLLEVMDVKHGFEAIGGLEKQILKLKKIALHIREGKTSLVPQGIMFIGPPGTGKTLMAEALAKESGINFVKPKDIKSELVGRSERRMSEFISALRDLSPVVCFVDETDQTTTSRNSFDGDSGTSRSLFKKTLECMSDPTLRGKILWVMATNRPDLIDPALKRPGRCDLRMPFLSPDERQLELICGAALKQFPEMSSDIKSWQPYTVKCEGYSGADMIEVVRRAWEYANECGRKEIAEVDMEWAIADYRPQTYDRAEILYMEYLAYVECSSYSLLPDDWRERIKKFEGFANTNSQKINKDIFQKNAFLGPWTSKELN